MEADLIEQNQGDCKGLQTLARAFVIAVVAVILAAIVGLYALGRAMADTQPTQAQIAACAPDATRFCGEFIPDHAAVKACMIRYRSQLSQACKEAFAK